MTKQYPQKAPFTLEWQFTIAYKRQPKREQLQHSTIRTDKSWVIRKSNENLVWCNIYNSNHINRHYCYTPSNIATPRKITYLWRDYCIYRLGYGIKYTLRAQNIRSSVIMTCGTQYLSAWFLKSRYAYNISTPTTVYWYTALIKKSKHKKG